METLFRALLFSILSVASVLSASAELQVKSVELAPPSSVSEGIRSVLEKQAIQVLNEEKPVLELWFRKDIPLKSASGSLDSIAETTLVGVIAVRQKGLRDYKDNDVPEGLYTARFGLQPQDGDHLGTAEYSYFLILIEAKSDKEVGGIERFRQMVKASGQTTPSGHPVVLSLRPVSRSAAKALPAVVEPAPEHKAIRLKVPAGTDGKTELSFDLVFEGHGHIQ
jgi:hypothetical protein